MRRREPVECSLHPGSKHHLITDATGVPLATLVTGGNRHDVTQLIGLVEAILPIIARRGKPHGSGLGRQRWPVERTLCLAAPVPLPLQYQRWRPAAGARP